MSESEQTKRYLAAFRRTLETPDGESRSQANLVALRKRLADEDRVHTEVHGVATAPGSRIVAGLFVVKSVSLSLVLGLTGVGAVKLVTMAWPDSKPPQAVRAAMPAVNPQPTSRPPKRVERAPVGSVPAVASAPDPQIDKRPAHVQKVTHRAVSRTAVTSQGQDPLALEIRLMRRGSELLDSKQWSALLGLTREHGRRFPEGVMREEREAWTVISMCQLGTGPVEQRRVAFFRRHPRSSLASRVRRACETQNSSTESLHSSDEGT